MESSLAVEATSQTLLNVSRLHVPISPTLVSHLHLLLLQVVRVSLAIFVPYFAARRSVQIRDALRVLDTYSETRQYLNQVEKDEPEWKVRVATVLKVVVAAVAGLLYCRAIFYDDENVMLIAGYGLGYVFCFSAFFMVCSLPCIEFFVKRTRAKGSVKVSHSVGPISATMWQFLAICLPAVGLTVLTFRAESELMATIAAGVVVFTSASQPNIGPLHRFWGGVIITLVFAMEIGAMVWLSSQQKQSLSSAETAALAFCSEFVGLFYVTLMTTVLRYETGKEISTDRVESLDTVAAEPIPISFQEIKRYESWKSYRSGGEPVRIERIPCVSLSAVQPSTGPTPLFKFLLALVVFGRISAATVFLLANYLGLKQVEGSGLGQNVLLRFVQNMPAQVCMSVLVAIVVLIAMFVRKDGREMRKFKDTLEGPKEWDTDEKTVLLE